MTRKNKTKKVDFTKKVASTIDYYAKKSDQLIGKAKNHLSDILDQQEKTCEQTCCQIGLGIPVDMVNEPPHYKQSILPNGIECIDVIEYFPTNLGTAIKYIWRAGLKNDSEEDLKKAIWYLNRQISLNKGETKNMK